MSDSKAGGREVAVVLAEYGEELTETVRRGGGHGAVIDEKHCEYHGDGWVSVRLPSPPEGVDAVIWFKVLHGKIAGFLSPIREGDTLVDWEWVSGDGCAPARRDEELTA